MEYIAFDCHKRYPFAVVEDERRALIPIFYSCG
jgi:hypothetical protein